MDSLSDAQKMPDVLQYYKPCVEKVQGRSFCLFTSKLVQVFRTAASEISCLMRKSPNAKAMRSRCEKHEHVW